MLTTALLVDDEEDIRTIGRMSLENLGGVQVSSAENGKHCLQVVRSKVDAGAPPDVILLDVMMPDMDGPTTLKELQRTPDFAGIPVIFMTAKVLRHEVEEYMRLGACGVIQKPFDPVTLTDEVRRILAER